MENIIDDINALIAEKQFENAKAILDKNITDSEHNIELLKLRGLCNINLEDYKAAKTDFETVIKYEPDDATSRFYLANCYDNLEDYIHAIAEYEEVIKLRDTYLDAYKNLCITYIKSNEGEKAAQLGIKALEKYPEEFMLYYIIGTAYMSAGKFSESIEYLLKANSLNPEYAQVYNNLGTSYMTLGNLDKAREYFLSSLNYDKDNSITYFNIASIYQVQGDHKEACKYFKQAYEKEDSDSYLTSWALSEVKSGDFISAIEHYKILATKYPEKTNFKYNLATCYEAIGDFKLAADILNQLVMMNPKAVSLIQKLAAIYMRMGKLLNAKNMYEKLILQGSVSHEIYYTYAHLCAKTGDLEKAEKILKKVLDLKPDFAPAHKDLGIIYMRKRLFDYAEDEFKKALEVNNKDFNILYEYANYLHATTQFEKADEYYQKALEIKPEDPDALGFSALNKVQTKDFATALKQIEFAIKHAPQNAFMLFIEGKIHFFMKNYEDAKRFLVRSYEMQQTPDCENMLGLTYFELEDYKQANNIFLHILKESPVNVTLLLNSAKCYEKLGEIDSALEQLNKLTEIFPECEEAQEMIRKLS